MSVLPTRDAATKKRHWIRLLFWGVLLAAALGGWVVYENFFRAYEEQRLTAGGRLEPFSTWSIEDRFKYGSIGVEDAQGVPYWIWLVLPRVFPEYLPGPGGYSSLGIVWEPGEEMPIGFAKRRIGYDRVGFNCALCHTATYRERQRDGRLSLTKIVEGGPAGRFDPQAYLNFISRCANDPRFNSDTLMEAIDYNVKLPLLQAAIYRHLLIPETRKALLEQTKANAWMLERPVWGPGRIDPFNPVKFGMLEMDPSQDSTVGNSDMMPLWEMERRRTQNGIHLHWDGLSTNLVDCCLAGALGDGATKKSLPVDYITDLAKALEKDFKAPPQYPGITRSDLVPVGKEVFGQHCAACHRADPDFVDGKYSNSVIRRDVVESLPSENTTTNAIATDGRRLRMWNPVLPGEGPQPFEIYNRFGDGYDWDLNSFVPTHGYVAVPLSGLWLRAPYLHNGSVPTLEDLLNPPMPVETLKELMDQSEAGSFKALQDRLSRADNASRVPGEQLRADLDRLRPAVDKLIAGARLLKMRPPIFYRGSDVLDGKRVGFEHDSSAPPKGALAAPYFTAVEGNGNEGHLYGTNLSDDEKRALVEFLKTL